MTAHEFLDLGLFLHGKIGLPFSVTTKSMERFGEVEKGIV